MRRILKKLSSLCLALVLSAGGLFNLNANATLEDISLEGLNAQRISDLIKYWQENFSYTDVVRYLLPIWLKKWVKLKWQMNTKNIWSKINLMTY